MDCQMKQSLTVPIMTAREHPPKHPRYTIPVARVVLIYVSRTVRLSFLLRFVLAAAFRCVLSLRFSNPTQ
jgi:hypothetical protein